MKNKDSVIRELVEISPELASQIVFDFEDLKRYAHDLETRFGALMEATRALRAKLEQYQAIYGEI